MDFEKIQLIIEIKNTKLTQETGGVGLLVN